MCSRTMASKPEIPAAPQPIVFDVQRSDLLIRAKFRNHLWSLFHNIPALYSALLNRLEEFGVTPNSIRSDLADSSLGAYNVNFWMMGFRAQVRIRLEQVEIDFNGITQTDVDPLERAFVQLSQALSDANSDFALSSYTVEIGLHGQPTGIEAKEFLASFFRKVPQLPGPYIGSGAVFYFGEEATALIRNVSVDLSGQLIGGLYVRIFSVFKESVRPETLRAVVEEQFSAALLSVGLRTGSS